jgi:hypothetical protein
MRSGHGISFLSALSVQSLVGCLAMALVIASAAPAAASRADDVKARIARLEPKYRDWLGEVALLIGKEIGRAHV